MALAEHNEPARIAPLPRPKASSAPRRRRAGLWGTWVLFVVAPLAFAACYLFFVAADQFASTVGFSVRKEQISSPIEMLGGVADFASSGSSDSDILYEFIQSQEMTRAIDARLGLVEIYSRPDGDPFFAYDENGTIEDLQDYWRRMVQVHYDSTTELIEVNAFAFRPEDAQAISQAIFDESARLVNELSSIAQQDTITFAKDEVDRAVERLKSAREAMTNFRSRTQILDPSADLQGQMGLLSTLEQQLAEALIAADMLRENARPADPRITQADLRVQVIEARIKDERRKLGVGGDASVGDDYATLLAEYERLLVEREFAEQAYTAALATYDQALSEARRKSRYLAAYIKPTLAEASQYPQKDVLLAIVAFFLFGLWGIGALVYYSIRDRR
jgi:capsular polysaccharide transport system permease protein